MALTVAANAITFSDSTSLSSGVITAAQLSAGAVTQGKIATGAVTRSNIGYPGCVLQVLQTTKLNDFLSTSGSPINIPGLSINITPTSLNSKILVQGTVSLGGELWLGGTIFIRLVRNEVPIFLGTSGTSVNSTVSFCAYSNSQANSWANHSPLSFSYLDSPNTISQQIYSIQGWIATAGRAWEINNRYTDAAQGQTSSITVMEITG